MDDNKKIIKQNCKKAKSYKEWRNPFHTWFVTLFDNNNMPFFEFQYSEYATTKERIWISKLLEEIDNRNKEK